MSWLISTYERGLVGVKTDVDNVANDICGFNLANYPDPISKVREIIKTHIDPIPRFYAQLVNPAVTGKAVLVVFVPSDQDTPFITKDGRIYRRTHDSSDPIPETNRGAVDRLIDEGRQARQKFAAFCKDHRTFSKGEANSNTIWLNVFIKPYSYEIIDKSYFAWGKELQTLLEKSRIPFNVPVPYPGLSFESAMPFNSGYPTANSVILGQTSLENAAVNCPTVEFFNDGRAKLHIPIQSSGLSSYDPLIRNITSKKIIDLFKDLGKAALGRAPTDLLRFFDAVNLWNSITTLAAFYLLWLDKTSVTNFRIGINLENIWRVVPFIDTDQWAEHIESFGFPVAHMSDRTFPENIGGGHLFEFDEKHRLGSVLFEAIALSFGLPYEFHATTILQFLKNEAAKVT